MSHWTTRSIAVVGVTVFLVAQRSANAQFITVHELLTGRHQFNAGSDDLLVPIDLPADCTLGVDENQVITIVNKRISRYDRSDLDNSVGEYLDDFTSGGYDPRVRFDTGTGQFVMSAMGLRTAYTDTDSVTVPLGAAGDPASAWYSTNAPSQFDACDCEQGQGVCLAIDRPSLGYDGDAWYVSASTLAYGGGDENTNVFYVLAKSVGNGTAVKTAFSADAYSDVCQCQLGCFPEMGIPGRQGREQAFAAVHIGVNPTPYFVGIAPTPRTLPQPAQPCGTDKYWALRVYTLLSPLSASNDLGPRFAEVVVPCFDAKNSHVPTGPNGLRTMGAGDGRITGAVWRQISGDNGMLYVVHSVDRTVEVNVPPDHVNQRVVRWYMIETNGWPLSGQPPTLFDSGQFDGGTTFDDKGVEIPVHLLTPAVSVSDQGHMAVVMARVSEEDHIGIMAGGRLVTGQILDPEVVDSGNSSTNPDPNRWGDYYDVVADPADPNGLTFWGFGALMIDNPVDPLNPTPEPDDDGWGTRLFQFEMLGN